MGIGGNRVKNNPQKVLKLFFLPIIVAFVVTLIIQIIEWNNEEDLIGFTMFENLTLFVLVFLGVYLFTLISATTIDFYIWKKSKNIVLYLTLFNIIGAVIVALVNFLVLKNFALNSLFLIFPLFSIFSVVTEAYSQKYKSH